MRTSRRANGAWQVTTTGLLADWHRKRAAEAEAEAPKAKNRMFNNVQRLQLTLIARKETTKTVKRKVVKAKAMPATPSGPSTVRLISFISLLR